MKSWVLGGLAGFVATAPMTALMEAWRRQLPFYERYPLPPRQITVRMARKAGLAHHLDHRARTALTAVSHFGYGTGAGALYGLACQRRLRAGVPTGVLYGLAVWTGSYLGLLPALKILEPATQHPRRRNALMIAAHVVWGATLGGILQWLKHTGERRR